MTPNKPGNGETAETGPCRLEVCGGCITFPENFQKGHRFLKQLAFFERQAKYLFSINKITKFVVFSSSHSDLLEAQVMSECGGH